VVIARAVEKHCGMGASGDCCADDFEMQVHHQGICFRHHDGRCLGVGRTSRAEEIGPGVTLVARRPGPCPALGPDAGQGALLADPCFVLEPDFERLAMGFFRERFGQGLGEVLWNGPPLFPVM